ncbi:MAG TPA: hypothetical protein VFU54_12290, partial [Actinomycetota bacterium]|nr:hypothetical protein [Actinomycetota bacterium]
MGDGEPDPAAAVGAGPGAGEAALEQAIRTIDPRLRGTLAALQAQRFAAPIPYDALLSIVDQWAETA